MPPISLFCSLPFPHAHEHACTCARAHAHTHTHTHTDVPSSGGVRSGDKATRGRGGGRSRRTTALTVLARGETESENGVFLPPGHL